MQPHLRTCPLCGEVYPRPYCRPCSNAAKHLSPADRFWRWVDKTQVCWLWRGGLDKDGYGQVGNSGGSAHRSAWKLVNGPIPPNLTIDHLCRNRRCVKPEHMELVTARENNDRGLRARRAMVAAGLMPFTKVCAANNHCKRGHEYTPANTIRRAGGQGRRCRTCRDLQPSYYKNVAHTLSLA